MELKSKIINFFLIINLILFTFCTKNGTKADLHINSLDDVKEFMTQRKNKIDAEKKIKNIYTKITYKTPQELAFNELGNSDTLNKNSLIQKINDYDSMLIFNLQYQIEDFQNEIFHYMNNPKTDDYSENLGYYSFGLQNDIWLEENDIKIANCTFYHLERNFGISPITNITIGFQKTSELATLVIENKHLGIGPVKFPIGDMIKNNKYKIIIE